MNPNQIIKGNLKQVKISADLLIELFRDGYKVQYKVVNGIPMDARLVTGYVHELYVGFVQYGIVFEHPSYPLYEGELHRIPEIVPDAEMNSSTD